MSISNQKKVQNWQRMLSDVLVNVEPKKDGLLTVYYLIFGETYLYLKQILYFLSRIWR